MKTTARNQFYGNIKAINSGATNDEIIIDIGNGLEVVAGITQGSTRRLNLEIGKEVIALIKAPWIILADDSDEYEFSTRNNFKGTVTEVKTGAVNSEVFLKTESGTELVAIVTNESVQNLSLAAGKAVKALFKAPHVILAVKKA